MEKIQFKRASSAEAFDTLSVGEIGVVNSRQTKYRGIVIGTDYGNEYIRAYLYNSNYVVTDISLENSGTNPVLKVTKHQFDGTESKYDLDFVISGTIDTANKLSSNAGSNTASKCQPIYFSGGKPTNITQTRGSETTPVWLHEGKIEPITSYSGKCTGEIDSTTGKIQTLLINKLKSIVSTDTSEYLVQSNIPPTIPGVSPVNYNVAGWKNGVYCLCVYNIGDISGQFTFTIVYTKNANYNQYSTSCYFGNTEYFLRIGMGVNTDRLSLINPSGTAYTFAISSCQKIG